MTVQSDLTYDEALADLRALMDHHPELTLIDRMSGEAMLRRQWRGVTDATESLRSVTPIGGIAGRGPMTLIGNGGQPFLISNADFNRVLDEREARRQSLAAEGTRADHPLMSDVAKLLETWQPATHTFLVDKLLRVGYRALLAAYEDTGKTYVALQVALSVIDPGMAGPLFGQFRVNEAMAVCYFDMEVGTGEALDRIRHLSVDLRVEVPSPIFRLTTLDDAFLSLKNDADLVHIGAELDRAHGETGRPVLCVLDSADSMYGKEVWGKEAEGLDAAIKTLMVGRRDWLVVLLLCHTVKKPRDGKSSYVPDLQDVLGNLTRQADAVILLDKVGPLSSRFRVFKRPGASDGILQRDEGRYAWTWTANTGATDQTKVPLDEVLAVLRATGRTSHYVVAKHLQVNEHTARRYLDQLEAQGKVASTNVGTPRGRWEYWAVQPAPDRDPDHSGAQSSTSPTGTPTP